MNTCRPPIAKRWPVFILLLAAFFLGLSAWSVYRAGNDLSPPLRDRESGYTAGRMPAND